MKISHGRLTKFFCFFMAKRIKLFMFLFFVEYFLYLWCFFIWQRIKKLLTFYDVQDLWNCLLECTHTRTNWERYMDDIPIVTPSIWIHFHVRERENVWIWKIYENSKFDNSKIFTFVFVQLLKWNASISEST